jgi:glutamate racemase
MIEANIDYLVLGCSHHPYSSRNKKKIVPDHIQIIDSGRSGQTNTEYTEGAIRAFFNFKRSYILQHESAST